MFFNIRAEELERGFELRAIFLGAIKRSIPSDIFQIPPLDVFNIRAEKPERGFELRAIFLGALKRSIHSDVFQIPPLDVF